MKTSTLLDRIIKKELANPVIAESLRNKIQIAQTNLNEGKATISEFYGRKMANDPNFKIKKPWSNVKLETTLKKLGARPFALGINPHGYELEASKDRLWFYSDGGVWSTNYTRRFGYTTKDGNTITLWNEQGAEGTKSGFEVGVIKLVGGKAEFIESSANAEKLNKTPKKKEEPSNSALDTFQTVLDWAGFVPVIGDAIDIINAIIYFIRGKWFDGFLSCIAIIPIIGSAIKLSIKAIYKGAKIEKLVSLIKSSLKTKDTAAIWIDLVRSGAVTPAQLKEIGTGLDSLSDVLKSSYSGIRAIPGGDYIVKQLDDFEQWMRNSGRSIDDLTAASKRAGDKVPFGKLPDPTMIDKVAKVKFLRRFANGLTGNLVPRLKALPWFPEKKLMNLAQGIEKRFAREMQDPVKLAALVKIAPNGKALRGSLSSMFRERIGKLPLQTQQQLARQLSSANISRTMGSADDISKLMNILKNDSAYKGLFDSATDLIVNHSMKNDSIIWNMFKTDRLNNLKTVLSKDMIPNGSALYKELDFSFRKNADIIWNEIQDAGESFGLKDNDDVNGVIWPIITASTAEYLPGVYDAGVTVKKWVTDPENRAALQGIKSVTDQYTGAGADEPYDPAKEAGGKFD
jgi:hypothetical protein